MQMELNNDRDDDSLDLGDFSQLKPLDDDDSESTPIVEITNPKLFDLTGENESVSTIGNSVASASVTFQEEYGLDDSSVHSNRSTRTEVSTTSQRNRIENLESASKDTSSQVAALRTEMSTFMDLLKINLPLKPAAPVNPDKQAAGKT